MHIVRIDKKSDKKQIVYFDNDTFCPLYTSEIKKYGIDADTDISEDTYREVYDMVVQKRAKLRAMNILQKFDKTERQLSEKLLQDGYDSDTVCAVIEYLKSYRYIDDYRYAENYYEYHCETESRSAIKNKLLQKGISADILEKIITDDLYDETALDRLIEKKQIREKCTDAESYRKQVGFLIRKGFSYDLIRRKLSENFKK